MSGDAVLLHGVPPPFPFEAPSSWLGRLALAQGCTVKNVRRFLGAADLRKPRDMDRALHGDMREALHRKCSLPARSFGKTMRVMDLLGPAPMLVAAGGWPRFSYCPICLSERPTAYLDIHWRYTGWSHCLVHSCLLEDRCTECRSSVGYVRDMGTSYAGRSGHASQRRCQICAADLAKATPRFRNLRSSLALTGLELHCLREREAANVQPQIRRAVRAMSR